MKIQAKVRRELQLIELDLKRAMDYLAREDMAVCRVGGVATTTLHMTRKLDGKIFYEVNKEIFAGREVLHCAAESVLTARLL